MFFVIQADLWAHLKCIPDASGASDVLDVLDVGTEHGLGAILSHHLIFQTIDHLWPPRAHPPPTMPIGRLAAWTP